FVVCVEPAARSGSRARARRTRGVLALIAIERSDGCLRARQPARRARACAGVRLSWSRAAHRDGALALTQRPDGWRLYTRTSARDGRDGNSVAGGGRTERVPRRRC